MDKTLEIVKKQINGKQAQLAEAMSAGAAKDFAEYRAMCGEYRGLSLAEGFILDLAKTMEQSDE
jgi:hypothetical protein